MKEPLKISLKANDRIYVNGAVIRVDRKTSIEFLNNVDFLLDNHVLHASDANTPLKQLYYIIQIMLMAPNDTGAASELYRAHLPSLLSLFSDLKLAAALKGVDQLVHEKSYFEAMKCLRTLFNLEASIIEMDQHPSATVMTQTGHALSGCSIRTA